MLVLPKRTDTRAFEVTEPLPLGCGRGLDVRYVVPGGDGTGAVLGGECAPGAAVVWLVGP